MPLRELRCLPCGNSRQPHWPLPVGRTLHPSHNEETSLAWNQGSALTHLSLRLVWPVDGRERLVLIGRCPCDVVGAHFCAALCYAYRYGINDMEAHHRLVMLITHMVMHGGIVHIFFNMFNLYMFGTILERVWGPKRFLEFYFITGFGAMLLHTGVQAIEVFHLSGSVAPPLHIVNSSEQLYGLINSPTIGASGAVFGLLTAFAMLFANTELYIYGAIPVKAKYLIIAMVLWELYSGFSNSPGDNVAHFAHLGGALIGFIIVKIWNRNRDFLY